jgi:hypothetical protein
MHALRASGMSFLEMQNSLRAIDVHVKRETLGKHFNICLGGHVPEITDEEAQAITALEAGTSNQPDMDFAILVRKRAAQMLINGELRVTASHGLQAQALLDRRAEKEADRDLQLNLARLLSGAITLPPSAVIEGRVVDVSPSLLAPGDVVEPRA